VKNILSKRIKNTLSIFRAVFFVMSATVVVASVS